MENTKMSDKTKHLIKKIISLLIKLSIVAIIIIMALIFIFGIFRLSGNNMYPALKDGDLCITYKLDTYVANDVVVYNIDGEIHFGRIIAREGDTIDGDKEGLLLNGFHANEEVFYSTDMTKTDLDLPITLGKDEFFILNDYRDDTNDSRTYGVVNKNSLKGKIIFIFRRRGF